MHEKRSSTADTIIIQSPCRHATDLAARLAATARARQRLARLTPWRFSERQRGLS